MAAIYRIIFDAPARPVEASQWGTDWRRTWCRVAGALHEQRETGALIAFYGDGGDAAERVRLQDELASRPNGVAEVLAACRAHLARHHNQAFAACLASAYP